MTLRDDVMDEDTRHGVMDRDTSSDIIDGDNEFDTLDKLLILNWIRALSLAMMDLSVYILL